MLKVFLMRYFLTVIAHNTYIIISVLPIPIEGKSPGACEPQSGHGASHSGQRPSDYFEILSGRS